MIIFQSNERMLFHGSPFINAIVQKGFDERHAYIGGMFGAGKCQILESILPNFVFLRFPIFAVKIECLLHIEKIHWL